MKLGFLKVVGKSLGKALKDVGLTAATVGGLAALTAVESPEVWAPVVAAVPGPVGLAILLVVPIAVKAAKDAIKHRDKM